MHTGAAALRARILSLHLTLADVAYLEELRPDRLRHIVAGTRPCPAGLWEALDELDAGIQSGAEAALRAGEAIVPAGNAIAEAIAARALHLAYLQGRPVEVRAVPGEWTVYPPDQDPTSQAAYALLEVTSYSPSITALAREIIGREPSEATASPPLLRMTPGEWGVLTVDDVDYRVERVL